MNSPEIILRASVQSHEAIGSTDRAGNSNWTTPWISVW